MIARGILALCGLVAVLTFLITSLIRTESATPPDYSCPPDVAACEWHTDGTAEFIIN